jgi:phytanoyl-CoA hydroxylase
MENYAIKIVLPSPRNMNGWFQYYISLGFTTYFVYADVTNDRLHNNILFYNNFVKIHINPTSDQLNRSVPLYILELEVDDLLYIPPNNTLIEFLRVHINPKSLLVEISHANIFRHSNLNDSQKMFSNNVLLQFYKKYGFLVVKKLVPRDTIQNIIDQAQNIYKTQMLALKLIDTLDVDNQVFEQNMKRLFDNHPTIFFNCAKHCQYIIDLWSLALSPDLIHIISVLGVQNPIISTRPILFSNSKHISKADIFHTVPPHQDWATMQGSINSIVCWLPLIDTNQDLGCIAFVPESHKLGLLMEKKEEGFGLVKQFSDQDFISLDLTQGDVLFFSSFLVHKSGNNITDNIRWSTHFRYNDLDDTSFIENGYPHAFIYKSVDEILKPEFDTQQAVSKYFAS